jgi:ATP-dependent Lon protease
MEVIRIAGYTEDEKVEIARKHLIPNTIKKHGLDPKEWSISDDGLLMLIRRYTREAGVRNLERELSNLSARRVKEIIIAKTEDVAVTAANLGDILGVAKFRYGEIDSEDQVGVVTGLAWTEVGGELPRSRAVMVPGKGKMTVTGNLKDVMKESISAARILCAVTGARFRHRAAPSKTVGTFTSTFRGRDAEGRSVRRHRDGNGDSCRSRLASRFVTTSP